MKIRAPAKINLNLHVTGRRKDGYHLLDTVMLPVSLYDELEIGKIAVRGERKGNSPLIRVLCNHPAVPTDQKNLAYRAARILLEKAKSRQPVQIRIRKRIPLGAGLGGGSTDAAATLVALNRLLKIGFSPRQLEKLGLTIGADVPFFIRGRPARARGIGERLTMLRKVPRWWLVILYPGLAVSTAWVYGNLPRKLTKSTVNTSISRSLRSGAKFTESLINDLESVTLTRYPRIAILKQKLAREGAVGTAMSGSGSSVFGIFGSRRGAIEAFRRLRKEEGIRAFLVHVLS